MSYSEKITQLHRVSYSEKTTQMTRVSYSEKITQLQSGVEVECLLLETFYVIHRCLMQQTALLV